MPAVRRSLDEQTLVPPQPQPWRSGHRSRRPPSLMEELIEEILLRLPRASLVDAALVCKPWHRLVSSPRFRRRFLEFHRTPPLLGFICNYPNNDGSSFVRTAAGSPLQLQRDASRWWSALDACHGRVLLRPCLRTWREHTLPLLPGVTALGEAAWVTVLKVWDLITDEVRELPAPPRLTESCTAAVLCSYATATGCDHHCCHRGPFQVVFVGTELRNMFICTYSSDVGAWSDPISIDRPECSYDDTRGAYSPTVLLKNQLYFGIERTNAALRYDLELHERSWIQLPKLDYGHVQSSVLTTTDDGRLGVVRVLDGVLCIWGFWMDKIQSHCS